MRPPGSAGNWIQPPVQAKRSAYSNWLMTCPRQNCACEAYKSGRDSVRATRVQVAAATPAVLQLPATRARRSSDLAGGAVGIKGGHGLIRAAPCDAEESSKEGGAVRCIAGCPRLLFIPTAAFVLPLSSFSFLEGQYHRPAATRHVHAFTDQRLNRRSIQFRYFLFLFFSCSLFPDRAVC